MQKGSVDVLDSFKIQRRSVPSAVSGGGGEIFFMIEFGPESRAALKVTDAAGHEVQADYRQYRSETFLLLRSLSSIREANLSKIAWGGSSVSIYIDEHPHLIYQLLRCRNIVDAGLTQLEVTEGKYAVTAVIHAESGSYVPAFRLLPAEGFQEGQPLLTGDFKLITDSYALSDNKIVEILPLGENYFRLPALARPFGTDIAESYLSILLSHFDHITLSFEDRECVASDTPVRTRPTLIFEKVDDGQSLYLRLTSTVPGVPPSFIEDFSPTSLVSFSPDGKVVIRHVEYEDELHRAENLRKRIASFAPDRKAAKEVYEEDGFFVIPSETAGPFLVGSLAELAKDYLLIGAEKLAAYKIRTAAPSLKISVSSGIDFLEGDGEIDIAGEPFSLADFLSQYQKNRYVQLSDGDKVIIDPEYVKRLERLVTRSGKSRKVKVSFFDLPEVSALLSEVPDCEIFRRSREFYEGFNQLSRKQLKTDRLGAVLRPYQKEGVKWIQYLYDNRMGGCLADDMGLGKTVQAIAMLTLIYPKAQKPSLIVMPRSLLFNWKAEFERFAPQLRVGLHYGQSRDMEESMKNQIILTAWR